ncbi:N-acetylmuramoyl-L-alanine amidase [Bacillus badius]|uniref:N-acetylmuramoyl-L-alanine amidase n=1 Tax=Bacillus badius TaxID=1455 RepID=UPI002E1BBEE3|nr:N-acetylmuramoyl-L-alanine amidase [Bacillus badius]MED0666414.1 N-acetylmuramoyl-L-alanine amidase [Bacillus badius]
MRKSSIILTLAFCFILPLFGFHTTAQASGFTDVPKRALKEVNYLAEGGIATGSSATIFAPDTIVTRAEAATFIARALQLDGKQKQTVFKDVAASNPSSGYIQSAVDKGILSGYSGGRFLPNKDVTRGEMAVMMSRAFGYEFGGSLSGAAKALTSRGIASGMEDGTFGSDKQITRVDFSVFLARAINPEFRTKHTASFKQTFWVNTNNLNVRTGPSTKYSKSASLQKDVKVVSSHEVGSWVYIQSANGTGFVHKSYLRNTEEASNSRPGGDDNGSNPGTIGNADPRLANQVIILDPGHGGTDPGASGFNLREKDVVLDTGLKTNELFKKTPFKVYMTRTGDTFPSLSDRTKFAKSKNGNVFVSIHANASNGAGNGTETYYYSSAAVNPYVSDSKLLATKIQQRMLDALQLKNRGVKPYGYYVIKYNSMPAALAELGFIDNAKDNEKLKSDYWRTQAAKALYLGILDYYKAKGYQVDSLYSAAK